MTEETELQQDGGDGRGSQEDYKGRMLDILSLEMERCGHLRPWVGDRPAVEVQRVAEVGILGSRCWEEKQS